MQNIYFYTSYFFLFFYYLFIYLFLGGLGLIQPTWLGGPNIPGLVTGRSQWPGWVVNYNVGGREDLHGSGAAGGEDDDWPVLSPLCFCFSSTPLVLAFFISFVCVFVVFFLPPCLGFFFFSVSVRPSGQGAVQPGDKADGRALAGLGSACLFSLFSVPPPLCFIPPVPWLFCVAPLVFSCLLHSRRRQWW